MVDGELGRGGFGVVLRAHDVAGTVVAIKLAHEPGGGAEGGATLEREIAALRLADGACTPRLVATGSHAGRPWLAMEWIDGTTHAELLARRAGALPEPAAALPRVLSLVDAVSALHGRGVVHRDLKPENVLERADGSVVLVDLGLALPSAGVLADPAVARAGTAEYMAPEQCDGVAQVSPAADVYSLAVLAVEWLTGAPPYHGDDAAVREAQRSARVRLPGELGPLRAVLEGALAKDPERRPRDARALRKALVEASRETTAERAAESPSPSVSGAPSPAGAGSTGRTKRSVAVLWITGASLAVVREACGETGIVHASAAGARHVVVCDERARDGPVRAAIRVGRALLARVASARMVVDLRPLVARVRADGERAYASPAFATIDNFPHEQDPARLAFTASAGALVTDMALRDGHRPGLLVPSEDEGRTSVTVIAPSADEYFGNQELLRMALEVLGEARGAAVLRLIGEAGVGKSAFAGEVLRRAGSALHGRVVAVRLLDPASCDPHLANVEVLLRALELPSVSALDDVLEDLLRGVDELAARPALELALGRIGPEDPSVERWRAAPGALPKAMARVLGRLIAMGAGAQPLALVLDDAHHASDVLLDALELAARPGTAPAPSVVLLGRPALEQRRPTFGHGAARRELATLGALGDLDAARLARRLLAPARNVSDRAVALLLERSARVPLLLVELVRGLRRDGALQRSQRGSGWVLATDALERLPDLPLVEWLSARELAALPESLLEHARLVAALGERCTAAEVEGVLALAEAADEGALTSLDPAVGLARLSAQGVLLREGDGALSFRHPVLRRQAYEGLDATRRTRIHRAAQTYFEQRPLGEGIRRWRALAVHAAGAGDVEAATTAREAIARDAAARNDWVAADVAWSEYLGGVVDGRKKLAALRARGLCRFRAGRYEDSVKDLEGVVAAWTDPEAALDRLEAMLDLATVLDWMDEYARSRDLAVDVGGALPPDAPALLRARLEMAVGRSEFRFSRIAEGSDLMLRAADAAEVEGEPGYETAVGGRLLAAAGVGMLGDLARADAIFEQCIRDCLAHEDPVHLATAYQNRAFVWMVGEQLAEFRADLGRVLALAREAGFPALEGRAVYNAAEAAVCLGDWEQAESMGRASVQLHRELQGCGGRTLTSLLALARGAAGRGDAAAVAEVLGELATAQAEARAQGRTDAELLPSDEVLRQAVATSADLPGCEPWDDVLARAVRDSVQSEPLEIADLEAVWAARRGDLARLRDASARAAQLAASGPSLFGPRLRARPWWRADSGLTQGSERAAQAEARQCGG